MTPAGCARLLALIAPIALTASCGSVPTRETPLNQVVPLTAPVLAPGVEANSDKLFVVVTFSGGGKRAAAFSYGVLEALRDIQVTTPDGELHSLLDEVDLISAVSGGAFTAAYYALHGHETFESYAPRFLNHDTEKDLWHKVLAPVNWGRLGNSLVSRSDLEVEYFDEKLFNGATVNDVMTRSPRVIRPSPLPCGSATCSEYANCGRGSAVTRVRTSAGEGACPCASSNSTRIPSARSGTSRGRVHVRRSFSISQMPRVVDHSRVCPGSRRPKTSSRPSKRR